MLTKQYAENGFTCRVTFQLPADVAARNVTLAGEFNDWDPTVYVMTRSDEAFLITLQLEAGRQYRFKYLLDGQRWENDWHADAYVANEFGSEDSVVIL